VVPDRVTGGEVVSVLGCMTYIGLRRSEGHFRRNAVNVHCIRLIAPAEGLVGLSGGHLAAEKT
jgi:hypothetical protein